MTFTPSENGHQQRTLIIKDPTLRRGFTSIPNAVMYAKGLSMSAKYLYGLLLLFAWQEGECFPGQERLAEAADCTDRTVRKYLDELKKYGLISWVQRGLNKTNIYYIQDLSQVNWPEPLEHKDRKGRSTPDRKGFSGQERKKRSAQERKVLSDKEYSVEEDAVKNTQSIHLSTSKDNNIFREQVNNESTDRENDKNSLGTAKRNDKQRSSGNKRKSDSDEYLEGNLIIEQICENTGATTMQVKEAIKRANQMEKEGKVKSNYLKLVESITLTIVQEDLVKKSGYSEQERKKKEFLNSLYMG